jgi:hypothetical protein
MVVYMEVLSTDNTYLVRFGDDDFGLYVRGRRNFFNSNLAVRGTFDEVNRVRTLVL